MKTTGCRTYWVGILGCLVVGLFGITATALAEIKSTAVDALAEASYQQRKQVLDVANEKARSKGLTLEALGKACNLLPVRIGAILSGQAPLEKQTQECLEKQLELKEGTLDVLRNPPVRWNAGAMYRLHEAIDVYAPALQRWMNERFGDAILSAIDFTITVEETKGSKGERRMRIILDGKALDYSTDAGWRPPAPAGAQPEKH
jgi:cyanate lyase